MSDGGELIDGDSGQVVPSVDDGKPVYQYLDPAYWGERPLGNLSWRMRGDPEGLKRHAFGPENVARLLLLIQGDPDRDPPLPAVTQAAAAAGAGISYATLKRMISTSTPDYYNAEFAEAVETAKAVSLGTLEAVAWQHAITGAQRQVLDKHGNFGMVQERPSEKLMLSALAVRNPDWGNRQVTLKGGLTVERVDALPKQLEEMPDELFERMRGMIAAESQRRHPDRLTGSPMLDGKTAEEVSDLAGRIMRARAATLLAEGHLDEQLVTRLQGLASRFSREELSEIRTALRDDRARRGVEIEHRAPPAIETHAPEDPEE